jgi:hypothetical protein
MVSRWRGTARLAAACLQADALRALAVVVDTSDRPLPPAGKVMWAAHKDVQRTLCTQRPMLTQQAQRRMSDSDR